MKRLLLLRHAKANPSSPTGDSGRDLAPRGRKDAAAMGAFLKAQTLEPQAILASPAIRTLETADLVRGAFAKPPQVTSDSRLYLADPQTLLETLRETDPSIGSLLLIGHNPGIAELADLLVVRGDPQGRAALQHKFPTAALAVIDLPIDVWQGASFHDGELQLFLTPKTLP